MTELQARILEQIKHGRANAIPVIITGATWVRLPSGLPGLNFDGTDDFVDCGNNAGILRELRGVIIKYNLQPPRAGNGLGS